MGLHTAIHDAGYSIEQRGDGNFYSNNDIAVQAIIDAYDAIPATKKDKRKELNQEGLRRIQLIFPAIKDFDDLDLLAEHYLSIDSTARKPTVKFQKLIATRQARNQARQAINALTTVTNALTTVTDINNYDVVNTPTWPV